MFIITCIQHVFEKNIYFIMIFFNKRIKNADTFSQLSLIIFTKGADIFDHDCMYTPWHVLNSFKKKGKKKIRYGKHSTIAIIYLTSSSYNFFCILAGRFPILQRAERGDAWWTPNGLQVFYNFKMLQRTICIPTFVIGIF